MYSVYMHLTPNGKRYIGITSCSIKERWKNNGLGYKGQVFYRAIQKYGWDNIQHIVLAENLSEDCAKSMEINLIAQYDTTNPKCGYNQSFGGDIKTHTSQTKQRIGKSNSKKTRSVETRKQISVSVKNLWQTDEYRKKQKNREVSDEAKHRMSLAHIGKKYTEEHIEKIRVSNSGKVRSLETRKRISAAVKLQHQKERALGIKRTHQVTNTVAGMKWYNNGIKNIRSKDGCPEGYTEGRLHFDYPKNRKRRNTESNEETPEKKTERREKKKASGKDIF